MLTRRTFFLAAGTAAAVLAVSGISYVPLPPGSDENPISEDDGFDINRFYLAVSREYDGSVTLTEIIDGKRKEARSFRLEDIDGIIEFIEVVGLAKLRFIDWHGEWKSETDVVTHEIAINWGDVSPLADLPKAFHECTDLLSCPVPPDLA